MPTTGHGTCDDEEETNGTRAAEILGIHARFVGRIIVVAPSKNVIDELASLQRSKGRKITFGVEDGLSAQPRK